MLNKAYEGLQENVRTLKLPEIETWQNQYKDRDYVINIDYPEFTCICPKTSLPDFANIHIEYCPQKDCVELKSFKLYLCAFRSIGIFNEHAANRILDDFVRSARPRWAKITAVFNARGGMQTIVRAEYKA